MRAAALGLALLAGSLEASSGAAMLRLIPDARSAGIAGADLATGAGSLGMLGDPADLARLERAEAGFSHRVLYAELSYDRVSFALPAGTRVVGLSLGWLGSASFDSTGGLEAPVSAGAVDLGAAVGKRLGAVDLGLSLGYYHENLGSYSWQAPHLSSSVGWRTPVPGIHLAAGLRNLSSQPWMPAEAAFALGATAGPVLLSLQGEVPLTDVARRWRAGLEWKRKALSLRAGLGNDDSPGQPLALAAGFGLALGAYEVDLAATGRGTLGQTLSATLRWNQSPPPAPTPVPTPGAAPTPGAQRPTAPVAQRTPVPTPPPQADAEPDWEGGSFDLVATLGPGGVELNWDDLLAGQAGARGYEIAMGLVPQVRMRPVGATQAQPKWRGDLGMRGLTYYFRVRALGPPGSAPRLSKVKAVTMP